MLALAQVVAKAVGSSITTSASARNCSVVACKTLVAVVAVKAVAAVLVHALVLVLGSSTTVNKLQ